MKDADLLRVVLSDLFERDLPRAGRKLPRLPYLATVIMPQNRAGREIPNVVSVRHGNLPVGDDGIHFNAAGQIKLDTITASAIPNLFRAEPAIESNELLERENLSLNFAGILLAFFGGRGRAPVCPVGGR